MQRTQPVEAHCLKNASEYVCLAVGWMEEAISYKSKEKGGLQRQTLVHPLRYSPGQKLSGTLNDERAPKLFYQRGISETPLPPSILRQCPEQAKVNHQHSYLTSWQDYTFLQCSQSFLIGQRHYGSFTPSSIVRRSLLHTDILILSRIHKAGLHSPL